MRYPGIKLLLATALLSPIVAHADAVPARPAKVLVRPAPQPAAGTRDPVLVARKTPAIAELLKRASQEDSADAAAHAKQPNVDEVVTKVALGGQCGFAGCSASTLVAFTYHTRGANTSTQSVLALVSCEPMPNVPCRAVPAEVRPTAAANPDK